MHRRSDKPYRSMRIRGAPAVQSIHSCAAALEHPCRPRPWPGGAPLAQWSRMNALAGFLATIDRSARTVILHDSDADGVTAGVVLQRGLERLGFTDIRR